MRRALAVLLLTVCRLPAQNLPPEVLTLARIRAHVREALDRLPDCTCLETVDRFVKPRGKNLRRLDTVVLQILFSGGDELFASPGDTRWETSPFAFLSSGMMGNGLFALHLRSIFLNNQAIIKYHGMESPIGRPEARYDFDMSRMLSGYTVHHAGAAGRVATYGSFWADPKTYDLCLLEFHAVDIPPELRYVDVSTAITYARVRIGESDVLLPQTADLRTTGTDGEENRDVIEFTHCQGYQAESKLRFGDANDTAAAARPAAASLKPAVENTLPPELRVAIALHNALDDHAAVGSLLEGKVVGAVTQKHKVLVPEGATVKGRLRRLERYTDAGDYFTVGLEFTEVETPDAKLRFYAELQDMDHLEGVEMTLHITRMEPGESHSGRTGNLTWTNVYREQIRTNEVPGVGIFFARGAHFSLPAGFKTVWKTQPYPRSATP